MSKRILAVAMATAALSLTACGGAEENNVVIDNFEDLNAEDLNMDLNDDMNMDMNDMNMDANAMDDAAGNAADNAAGNSY